MSEENLPDAKSDAKPEANEELSATEISFAEAEKDDISKRRSPWQSSAAAWRYVQDAASTDTIQLRTSDRVTILALLFCVILLVLPFCFSPLSGMRLPTIILSDIVLAICAVLFLIYRLGILCSLTPRQALVCWQLMLGCVFWGIFLCINVGVGVAFAVSNMTSDQASSQLQEQTPGN